MIFAYYDKYGILREIINDSNNRQGSNNDKIFAYFESEGFDDASIMFKIGDVESIQTFADHIETRAIPYNKEINYKYFKDNTPYKFYVFVIDENIMSENGVCKATITLRYADNTTHTTQGLLTFNIQDSVVSDETIFQSQLQYLLDRLSEYEFIAKNGIIALNDTFVDGQVAPTWLREQQIVLTPAQKTSVFDTSQIISGFKLFRVVYGYFQLFYSSLEDSDKVSNNERVNTAQNVEITDLKNRLDSLVADFSDYAKKSELSQVAFTGNYNDLNNKPNIPTQLSELTNNTGFITNAVSDLINYYKKDETLTKDDILARINAIKTIKFEIYESLDNITSPQSNVIYLIGSASPYEEYAYIEGIGFELLGSTSIDLSNYTQSDNVLNNNNIVVGSGEKKVKDSGIKINSYQNSGRLLFDDDAAIPTSYLVYEEIQKYHHFYTINGDSGTISGINYGTSPYFLIIDENLLVYRRVNNSSSKLVYHSVMVVDNTHFRDYFLTFDGNNYTRTYTESVSHTEFDELVSATPTDITYDSETKVVQLSHDGNPIGQGAEISLDGFTPYFEDKGLHLGDVENIDANLATKEYVDNAIGTALQGDY